MRVWKGSGGTPEKPARGRQDRAGAETTPQVAMAGSDHPRLTVLRVKFSYPGLLGKIFGVGSRWKE